MELLLWRWSTIVQICSDLMIAFFFISLARSTKRIELKPWVQAWLTNLGALFVAVIYWTTQPTDPLPFHLVTGFYMFFKTLFLLFLLRGLQRFTSSRLSFLTQRNILCVSFLFALIGGLSIPAIPLLGVIQSCVIGLTLTFGTYLALKDRSPVLGWIAVGFAARTTLGFVEAYSYWLSMKSAGAPHDMQFFLAAHSSFDSAAEWCIALGCVLALYRTIQNELTLTCNNLINVKNDLQDLVDRDPLTGLGNRRTLRHVLDKAKEQGATIIFFDLDKFKVINDRFGHQAGDECLQRFANALKTNFRPEDHIIRFAGDEFIVVAENVQPEELNERINTTRSYLVMTQHKGPRISFSVGLSYLPPGGEPDKAMKEADVAMYQQKKELPLAQ